MKVLGVISLICSLLTLTTFIALNVSIDAYIDPSSFLIIATVIVVAGMLAQVYYVLRTQSILSMRTYENLETIDNEMAFLEDEKETVKERQGVDVFAAVIAGLVWVFLFFFLGFFPGRLFSNEWDVTSVLSKIFQLSGIIGGFPSLIYNLRTWNRMVVR